MNLRNYLIVLVGSIAMSCAVENDGTGNSGGNGPGANGSGGTGSNPAWLIPQDQVLDGGPGKDGIPALRDPETISASEVNFLSDNDLVIGYGYDGDFRAYPHKILDWHEIINDKLTAHSLAVTYCPLTGTGIGWDRIVDSTETTFGVSGLLYNTNLIPYDRLTGSNWTQIGLQCVNGVLQGKNMETIQMIETNWKTWKELFPDSKVVSTNTGYGRNYNAYPYGDYRTNNNRFLFPVEPVDGRLPAKERVLAVIDSDEAKVYRFSQFEGGTRVVTDFFNNIEIIVVGNKTKNFMTAFFRELNGAKVSFSPANDADPQVIFQDDLGNKYDLFGRALSGPNAGDKLKPVTTFMAFWFSVGAFYTMPDLYHGGN